MRAICAYVTEVIRESSMAITEGDLIVPALRLLAQSGNGFMTTSALIQALEEHFQPDGDDAELLLNRSDTKFTQRVRNLVSHRGAATGLEARGLASYDADNNGWHITDKGRALVDTVDGSAQAE